MDASQRKAWPETDSPQKSLLCGENSWIHWIDQRTVADDKMKWAVEMSREDLLGKSLDKIFRRG